MKKNLVFFIILAVTIAAGWFFLVHNRITPKLKTAKQYEMSGNLQNAHSLYTEAVFDLTPSTVLPDINRSKVLSPEQLKKEIEKYFIWITGSFLKPSEELHTALEGMKRCAIQARTDNYFSDTVFRPLSSEEYLSEWNRTFFSPKIKIDPSHAALASGNYARTISILEVHSSKNYTYDLNLINISTNRGIRCILYPESSVRFYAPPGEFLLLCRSTVTFPTEEIWRSHFTALPLTIPQEATLVSAELRTSVHRK